MTKNELTALLDRLGIIPSRKRGQNFLIDPNMLDALVAPSSPVAGDNVVEVGAGPGNLTVRLAATGAKVTAIEIDRRFADYLEERFASARNVQVIGDDACRLDYDALFGGDRWRCISNLPYAATSPLLFRFLEQRCPPADMFIVVQREVANRLAAAPASKAYGALTVRVQLHYDVQVMRRLPPDVFYPSPDVDSAQVRLVWKPRDCQPEPDDARLVSVLARLGFGQRRKRLRKLLLEEYEPVLLDAAFAAAGIGTGARAEELLPAQFLQLAQALKRPGGH